MNKTVNDIKSDDEDLSVVLNLAKLLDIAPDGEYIKSCIDELVENRIKDHKLHKRKNIKQEYKIKYYEAMTKLYKCVEDAKKKIDEVEKSLKNVEECIEVKDKEENND